MTLEVICGGDCPINYSIAGRIEALVWQAPIWRRQFDRYPRFPERVELTAAGQVERIRIYVGGDVVASAERGPADTFANLSVETTIPRQPDAPPPDTMDLEGLAAGRPVR